MRNQASAITAVPRAHQAGLSSPHSQSRLQKQSFPHHRLDAYVVSLEALRRAASLVKRIPRGHGHAADQLRRASLRMVLGIAEGASRRSKGDKRYRYEIARGECGECAAVVEALAVLELVPTTEAHELMQLLARVSAMLQRLIRRYQ